jgi:hypothetical protein
VNRLGEALEDTAAVHPFRSADTGRCG